MGRAWCWGVMTQECPSTLGHLSVPNARLIQHESTWVRTSHSLRFFPFRSVEACNSIKASQERHSTSYCYSISHGFFLVYITSRPLGNHHGAVDPLCFVVSVWGWTLCLVLHRWIGSPRAGTLRETLNQRGGVCACVCVCAEAGVHLNLHLSQLCTQTHTPGLTQTHIQFIHNLSPPISSVSENQKKKKITTPFTFVFPPFSLVVGGRRRALSPQPAPDWTAIKPWRLNRAKSRKDITPCRRAQPKPQKASLHLYCRD